MSGNQETFKNRNLLPYGESENISAVRFDSCNDLYEEHQKLLELLEKSYDPEKIDENLITKVKAYIAKARHTGVILKPEEERSLSQSVLNYWANILYSSTQEISEAILADYDPQQVPKQESQQISVFSLEKAPKQSKPKETNKAIDVALERSIDSIVFFILVLLLPAAFGLGAYIVAKAIMTR